MKKQRVIICADVRFPKEDPGANRIEFVAKALQMVGFEVCILSHGRIDYETRDQDGYAEFNGIKYWNMQTSKNAIKKNIEIKIGGSRKILAKLYEMDVQKNDIIYVYGNNAFFVRPLLSYCRKNRVKSCIDVVEWHQPYQYKGGVFSPRYQSLNYTFKRLAPKFDYIIAISNCIKEYYEKKHEQILILPPMTEVQDVIWKEKQGKKAVTQLIYPGNPITKDDINVMLEALASLTPEQRKHFVFNITGISEEKLRMFLGKEQRVLDEIGESVIFHGFMEYSSLIELYENMDYLYFSRYDNLVTRANFPSKVPELMAKGIVPIGNKVGDYYLYLEDGVNSILFDKNDALDCASALERVIKNNSEISSMKGACVACAKKNFDYKNWTGKMEEFFIGEDIEK